MARHHRFLAWQRSQDLALLIYRTTMSWPAHERYGITSQVRRAAVSVPANIAEGVARYGRAEFARFLGIALGSLGELDSLLDLACRLEYLSANELEAVMSLHGEAGRLIVGLKRRLTRSPGAP